MNLSTLLRPDRINLTLKARKKVGALRELVSMIKTEDEVDLLLATLLKREELGSTGIGKGIAIPHCRSLIVDKLELAVGRSDKGINFEAIDRKPVHLFFLIVAPPQDPGNQYLITLGEVALIAAELSKKQQFLKPKTPEEFLKLLNELEKRVK